MPVVPHARPAQIAIRAFSTIVRCAVSRFQVPDWPLSARRTRSFALFSASFFSFRDRAGKSA
eukprot:11234525-Heterocapsa_arctica.AAC.1